MCSNEAGRPASKFADSPVDCIVLCRMKHLNTKIRHFRRPLDSDDFGDGCGAMKVRVRERKVGEPPLVSLQKGDRPSHVWMELRGDRR